MGGERKRQVSAFWLLAELVKVSIDLQVNRKICACGFKKHKIDRLSCSGSPGPASSVFEVVLGFYQRLRIVKEDLHGEL